MRLREVPEMFRTGDSGPRLTPNAKASQHFAPADSRDRERSAIEILDQPFAFQRDAQQGRADRAADVRPPLAPVDAGKRKAAPQLAGGFDIDAQRRESFCSFWARFRRNYPRKHPKAIPSRGSGRGARRRARPQCGRSSGAQRAGRSACSARMPRATPPASTLSASSAAATSAPFEAVVAMFSLREYFHQSLREKPLKVRAGGRWADVRHHRQLRAGAGAAVREAIEHAGPRGFADRGGYGRHTRVSTASTFMLR